MAEAVTASVDGQITPPDEAMISILDEGLVRGDGAFEVLKLYDRHPFRLRAHLDRLGRSAAAIHLPYDAAALEREIEALLAANPPPDGCLRIVVTRGGRRILTAETLPPFAPSISVALVELTPSEILGGVKSISYAANMQATRIAAARGADEAVYVRPDGVVLEAPTSSVFWVTGDGALRTPALGVGILDSITRDVLVEALDVEEGEFDRSDLIGAEAAFLASTNREVQPISAVEGTSLPTLGGEWAERARSALADAVAAERAAASERAATA
ncbi:MAG: aminotransferase class IV [Solirubrobacterales bacterium]|nr:aminotransferase class IV [Solirubrobacterales bacterium]MCB8970609.1 aminotransferase class IV [Thermoleophilales bacterium]MCO5325770.1 aminotransferase class IV [Solirubrobacterales bacterium]